MPVELSAVPGPGGDTPRAPHPRKRSHSADATTIQEPNPKRHHAPETDLPSIFPESTPPLGAASPGTAQQSQSTIDLDYLMDQINTITWGEVALTEFVHGLLTRDEGPISVHHLHESVKRVASGTETLMNVLPQLVAERDQYKEERDEARRTVVMYMEKFGCLTSFGTGAPTSDDGDDMQ